MVILHRSSMSEVTFWDEGLMVILHMQMQMQMQA